MAPKIPLTMAYGRSYDATHINRHEITKATLLLDIYCEASANNSQANLSIIRDGFLAQLIEVYSLT